jgi:two-component system, response regulator YesN
MNGDFLVSTIKIQISPFHLSKQFKKEATFTITEFIHNKRITEAKFLIEQNGHSITEIALMVGFENINYFCTVFKKITSLTPKEYDNKIHKKK